MDREAQIQAIDEDLRALHGMPVDSDQSARDALTQAMVTVRRINQLSAQAQAQAMMGAGTPMDDILAKLREWFDRLVTELTRIVEKLAQATSFFVHGPNRSLQKATPSASAACSFRRGRATLPDAVRGTSSRAMNKTRCGDLNAAACSRTWS